MRLVDAGVRAYDGRNRKLGALKAFLDAVEDGGVKPGSVLIVEDVDRLSREDIPEALPLFLGLIQAGLTVYVVRNQRAYDRESLAAQPFIIMEAILAMILAHDESKKKSYRSKAWWEGRRQGAKEKKPMTGTCPAWLRLVRDKYVVVPEAADAVRKVLGWLLDGYGLTAVTRRAVEENVPAVGKSGRWVRSYIQQTAHNRELIGEYQPHVKQGGKRVPVGGPIPGYYPAVLSDAEFARLQVVLAARRTQTGPGGGKVMNLFTGLLRAEDGGTLIANYNVFKGKRYDYLTASSALEYGTGKRNSVPYDAFEFVLLKFLREITPEQLSAGHEPDEIETLEAAKREKERRIEAVQESLEGDADDFPALVQVLKNLEKQKQDIDARLEEARARRDARSPVTLRQTQTLIGLLFESEGQARLELRTRLRSRIKEVVESIDVKVEGSRYKKRVFVRLHFFSGVKRGVWFGIDRGKLDGYGLWTDDGKFSMADLDHFTQQLTGVPAGGRGR
jgi:DNA invertase Pin-like site-specific DNA recombinase